jgi:hypothetical protein
LASPKEGVKTYAQKYYRRILMLLLGINWTWWKSDSRITKSTGTTIVINEDPITEESY